MHSMQAGSDRRRLEDSLEGFLPAFYSVCDIENAFGSLMTSSFGLPYPMLLASQSL